MRRKRNGLSANEEAHLRILESPMESVLNRSDVQQLLSNELVTQLESDQGAQENGTATGQWPKLKPAYAEWKKSQKGIKRFGSVRPKDLILVLYGALYDSLKKAKVSISRNRISVAWGEAVRSGDGFDYPSYWQGQNGSLSKHHAGFRKFVGNKRMISAIEILVMKTFRRHADKMGLK